MKSNYHIYQTSKITLIILLLVGVSFSSYGGVLPSVSAQGVETATLNSVSSDAQFNPLLSNSLLLYSPSVLNFNVQKFLDLHPGPLKNFSEKIDDETWTAAETIRFNAILFGINPQLILISLEADGNLINNESAEIPLRTFSGANINETHSTFYSYVNNLTSTAMLAFDRRRFHQDDARVVFLSGEQIDTLPQDLNAGTFAVQAVLAEVLPVADWELWVQGSNPLFKKQFLEWFGNPLDDPDFVRSFATLLPNSYNLPFPSGQTWYFTGGPHHYCGRNYPRCSNPQPAGRPWSSIDIAPPEIIACPGGNYPTNRWITAARGGTVIQSSQGLVVIDHGDGWRTYYSHVSTADRHGNGGVNQGDQLGHPSCETEPNGSTDGIHVHFAIWHSGEGFVNITDSSLSGWHIQETSFYNGTMTRQGVTRTATTGRFNGTNDILNSGSVDACRAPTLNGPPADYVSPSQTITFSWSALSGCTFNGYTLRIRTDTNMDATTPHIYDQGVGETSRSVDIPASNNNQDLYWGVRAANAPNGANWSIRKFRIQTVMQPTRVSTTVNVPSIAPGGTALVSVSLLDAPPNTYASAEFICTFNATVVEARDIAFSNLFGADAVPIFTAPQKGSFIAAIAGSNGSRATTGGEVLTFNLKGLQVGQTTIECTGRVSKGDNFAIPLPSSGSLLKVQSRPDPVGFLRGQVVAAKPVTVKVRTPDNTIIPVPVQPDGTFILPVFPGNYTVDASASGFLSAETPQGSVTVRDGDTITLPTIRLLAGDIDGNNVINQLDAMTIGMNYGTSTPAEADLNNDSVIDFLDLELLARNYLKTGPVAWQENNTNAETLIDPSVE